MSNYWDPLEHMEDDEVNDFAVRQELFARRRLADIDSGEIDAAEKNRKMLAAVVPKAKVCCYTRVEKGRRGDLDADEPKRKVVCHNPGARYVALTGDWFCHEHDPLRRPGPPVTGCCGQGIVVCSERDGAWACGAGITGHGWPHRFSKLEGMR